jgi:alpha-glucosidase
MDKLEWWQKAVFYQIYPRSFADGNGDGIGDFLGIIERLDYLQQLGIDAIWLSPHYPSPLFDCGYDVADYTAVSPEYGSLHDFKCFLKGAHDRDIRVILDLVLNHTSDQHPWFFESRLSQDNPKRDWYVWRNGKNGAPPNNWVSPFGGPAWTFDSRTGQYYYHFFFKEQPDLNWENPDVKNAMFDAARFWLDMGVDGFRLDAIGTIFEHPELPDHPIDISFAELRRRLHFASSESERKEMGCLWDEMFQYQLEQPGMHELMQELRAVIDEYDNRVLVAENEEISYLGDGTNEMHMVYNFPLMRTDRLTPTWVRDNQDDRLGALEKVSMNAWPCNTLGNHDSPRVYNKFGDGDHDDELARISLALILTLRGTPFLYYGEEIGMTDLYLEDISQFRDNLGVWLYNADIEILGINPEEALTRAAKSTRDKNRTPMHWSNSDNAGFSPAGVSTWLPINPDYMDGITVEEQMKDPNSLLSFYREFINFRKLTPALIAGEYDALSKNSTDYLAFTRKTKEQFCLIVLNFSDSEHTLRLDLDAQSVRSLYTSHEHANRLDALSNLCISPFEIYIGELI